MSDGVTAAGPVHAIDRRHLILQRVAEEQTIHVAELARDFRVSEMTVRRDLRRLERDGFLRQTYGGATAHLTRSFDLSFNARAVQHAREKRLIGLASARLVGEARSVFVGIGTTAEQFARSLAGRPDMLVVTASLPIASLLGSRPVRVVALGGIVLRDELSCTGPIATATLARYRFELAVIGTAGLSARSGITELTDEEAEIQRVALARSDRVICIADGSKVGAVAMAAVAPAGRLSTLVTDASAPEAELAGLRALGVQVSVVGGTEGARLAGAGERPASMAAYGPRR
ncbi:MAG: DeoR/GlpR family DNA-binding transcription regulator [Chloroflexota bacterium]|nr:DeoR/GlpR family DNA-binding transcription regulator [Chloroflexota bacterium]